MCEMRIFEYLAANNFGAFAGENSIRGGGPPSRGGSSQRGNRGSVSDEKS
jgi:hypothetical protein